MSGNGKPNWHQSMFWYYLRSEVDYEAICIVDSSQSSFGVLAKATDKDTPGVLVEPTSESIWSVTKTQATSGPTRPHSKGASTVALRHCNKHRPPTDSEKYGKGVVFNLLLKKVVVVELLRNVLNRMPVDRKVLKEGKSYDDLSKVAKLFGLYSKLRKSCYYVMSGNAVWCSQ